MLASILQKTGFKPGRSFRLAIPKLLMAATVAGGAVTLLSVRSASAAPLVPPLCWFGSINGGATTECTSGIQFNLQDKLVTLGSLTFGGKSGTLGFQYTAIDPPSGLAGDQFSLATDFNPDTNGPYSGEFDYTITITNPNYTFATAALDSVVSGGGAGTTVIKKIAGFADLVSTNGSNVLAVPVSGTTLSVRNIWAVGAGDVLDNFKDTYTQKNHADVPGPLPLLGAGAAFGFSRRLRSRVLAARRG